MKRKLTYTALFVAILLIGFVIGFLVQGTITRSRIRKMRSTFTERGVNREFIRAIRPAPEQMEQLKPILKKYAGMKRNLMTDYRSNQHELFLKFRQEINPYLTPEQKERLDQMDNRWKRRFMHSPGRGPGPRGKGKQGWN